MKYDMKTDIVVVGGGTGQFAAIVAASHKMDVILLEKRSAVGGAMAFSGGNAWLANTEYSRANGDSYEKAKEYLDHMQMGMDNEEIVNTYLRHTQQVVDICKKVGIGLKPLPRGGEYQSNWKGAQNKGGRSCQVLGTNVSGKDISAAGGQRLNESLKNKCKELGVHVLVQTAGKELITKDNHGVPEVVGIVAKTNNGKEIRIKANRGVILATGGFEWNKKMVSEFLRVPLKVGAAISWPANNGDGLKMVQKVGAQLSMMNTIFGMPFFTAHAEYAAKHHTMASMAGNAARNNSGSIMVDQTARRFVREDSGYMSFVNAFGGYQNFGDEGYSANPAWWICDHKSYVENGGPTGTVKSWGYPDPNLPEKDYVYKANSIEALAKKIGLNPTQLEKTIKEYNHYAERGKDPLFHRGENKTMGAEPKKLVPLEEPPYYAVAMSAGAVGTIGGPRLNKHAQVLHISGKPIVGLYAMGNCAGVGGPGPSYGGEGGTIGPALTFGTIAVLNAAKRENVDHEVEFKQPETESVPQIDLKDNEYLGKSQGLDGEIYVKVSMNKDKIAKVQVLQSNETVDVGDKAIKKIPQEIVDKQSTDVDAVSGATASSKAIINAVKDAIKKAK